MKKILISIALIWACLGIGSPSFSQNVGEKDIKENLYRIFDILQTKINYPVGFRQIKLTDLTRSFGNNTSRLIQASIWYPAISSSKKLMTVEDYVNLHKEEVSFGVLPFSGWAKRMNSEESRVNPILSKTTLASYDLPPSQKQFPLIIYASSFRSSAYENFSLFEYLAGKGFVIFSIPSVGKETGGMTMDKIGAESQFRDLKIAFENAIELPFVNKKRVGTMGFSLGAVSAALLAFGNSNINAFVSIDGGINYTYSLFENNLGDKERKFTTPYLQFTQKPYSSVQIDNKFYDSHRGSSAYHFQWRKLDHYDFSSITLLLKSLRPNNYKPTEQEIQFYGINETPYEVRFQMHKQMIEIIYLFFDSHLRNSKVSKKELNRRIESTLPFFEETFLIRQKK